MIKSIILNLMKNFTYLNNRISLSFLLLSITIGSLIRLYNLNYDNLWFDEIVSFWVADPTQSIIVNYNRHNQSEGGGFLFNLILTFTHELFGYKSDIGRYLSAIFGILSIFSIGYLAKKNSKNNFYLLVIFLISSNIFLIKYSQELRVYSLLFFLSILTLIFFDNLINLNQSKKKIYTNSFLFIFFQILTIMSHLFGAIIFFSIATYYILYFILKKKLITNLNIPIFLISIFLLFYISFYLKSAEISPTWITQPGIKFFTNFYFSDFFGSRLMGIIHLVILICLLIKFRKKIFFGFNLIAVLFIILILSYVLPLTYGVLFKPIILSRFIIFALIPIIFLISYFIFEIKNSYIKNFLFYLLIIITIGNHLTEATTKQFFDKRSKFKPDYSTSLGKINESGFKKIFLNDGFNTNENKPFSSAIKNYITIISKEKKLGVSLIKIDEIDDNNLANIWILCPQDLGKFGPNCSNINIQKNFIILEDKFYNNINIKLLKFIQ
jgi:hypothetical protein